MSAARGPRPAQRRSFGCRRPYGAALLLLLVGRSTGVAEAQAFETVGVRALGMGGAFVAVADDATANYWNPAGLIDVFFSGVLDVQRIDTRLDPHPTRREGASNLTTFASLASPTLGLSYYRLRSWQVARVVKGPEGRDVASLTSLVTHHGAMTVVQPLAPGLTIASVVRVVRGTAAMGLGDGMGPIGDLLERTSKLPGRSTTRFDLDVGVMVGSGAVKLGLVGRNLREPQFAVSDDTVVKLTRQLRAGLSVRPTPSLVVAVDVDVTTATDAAGPRRSVAVGAEQRLGWLVVRGGGRVNVEDPDSEPVGSLGLSVEVTSGFWLDGQVTGGRHVGDRGWGMATRVGF